MVIANQGDLRFYFSGFFDDPHSQFLQAEPHISIKTKCVGIIVRSHHDHSFRIMFLRIFYSR